MVTKTLSRVFGGIGGAFLLVVLFLVANGLNFKRHASMATGTVIRQESTGRQGFKPTIRFTTAAGQSIEFASSVSSSPPEFEVGQTVRVLYLPDDPADSAKVDSIVSFWFVPGLFGLFALTFGGIGTAFFMRGLMKQRMQEWLRLNGRTITADIVDVRINTSIRMGGKSPYVVVARWEDPVRRIASTFRSDPIWTMQKQLSVGDTITVTVDPNNLERYHVNVGAMQRND